MVICWAMRLGSFLFYRVVVVGEDSRFNKIKKNFVHFLFTWIIQGFWITITSGPAIVILTKESQNKSNTLNMIEILGIVIWVIGMVIEAVADYQKFVFKMQDMKTTKFIQTGLWSYSRHPNYCAEIVIWIGVSVFGVSSLDGLEHAALISPIFVYLLLTKLSGVPILEGKANKRWGNDPEYIKYKENTPVMFPWGKTGKSKNQ